MDDLRQLEHIIRKRAKARDDQSYTAKLLKQGVAYSARKMGEEALETLVAAIDENDESLVSEAADLIYHLLIVLRARNIDLSSVFEELQRRTTQSGLEEKALRLQNQGD